MPEQKYYQYVQKPAPQSFSDVINQQIELINQRKSQEAVQQMQVMAKQQQIQDTQAKSLYGFNVDELSDMDREIFNAKKGWMKDRIDNYHYSGANRNEFQEDVATLKTRFEELKAHTDNTKAERAKLEGWVSGTQPWTDSSLELKDDINSYQVKLNNWKSGGIDASTLQIDPATGDAYAAYTDINGNPLMDEQGMPQYGPAHLSPTRGAKEYFTPTTAPYANLLPGKFSKDFSAAASRLRKNENMSLEEKQAELMSWVTATAAENPSVVATANTIFEQNYGPAAAAAIAKDAENDPGDGSYTPIQLREYVDETMKFLVGNLVETESSDGSTTSVNDAFPGSQAFDPQMFMDMQPTMLGSIVPDTTYGEGITALMVPKTTAGRSSVTVESSWNPNFFEGGRKEMVGDNYKVASVGMDTSRRLFVMAEMYVEEDKMKYTEEQLARMASLPGVVISDDKVKRKKEIPILVEPTTVNIDGNSTPNQEWISIVAQIGRVAGVKDDRRAQIMKGMEILNNWNDETAQINASLPAGM